MFNNVQGEEEAMTVKQRMYARELVQAGKPTSAGLHECITTQSKESMTRLHVGWTGSNSTCT